MAKLNLSAGAKVNITAVLGGEEIELKSSYAKEAGGKLQFSAPLAGGKSVTLKDGSALQVTWTVEDNKYILDGTVAGTVKQGIRNYLMVTAAGEPHREERRAHIRVPAELDLEITIYSTERNGSRSQRVYPGRTSDISSGGVAMYTDAPMAVGEIIDVTIVRRGTKKLPLRGTVCWIRPAPRTAGFRDSTGLQFLFTSSEESAVLAKLTTALAAKQA